MLTRFRVFQNESQYFEIRNLGIGKRVVTVQLANISEFQNVELSQNVRAVRFIYCLEVENEWHRLGWA